MINVATQTYITFPLQTDTIFCIRKFLPKTAILKGFIHLNIYIVYTGVKSPHSCTECTQDKPAWESWSVSPVHFSLIGDKIVRGFYLQIARCAGLRL